MFMDNYRSSQVGNKVTGGVFVKQSVRVAKLQLKMCSVNIPRLPKIT